MKRVSSPTRKDEKHHQLENDKRAINNFREFLKKRTISAEGPKGFYQQAVDFLLNYGKELGFQKYEIFSLQENHPILIMTWEGEQPEAKSVLLYGHYDVVPADASKWTCDPWDGVQTDNGNIYGRGTQDMKCVLIQYMEAVSRLMALAKEGKIKRPTRTVHLAFLPDEEIGGFTANQFSVSEKFKSLNAAVALDEGLANTTNNYTVFYGERAIWWVNITAEGPAGHASRFVQRTAIEKLTEVLSKIYKFRSEEEAKLHPKHDEVGCSHAKAKKLGDVTTINVTGIKGYVGGGPEWADGFAINCIPTEAIAALDVRIPPSVPLDDIENIIKEWTKEEGLSYRFYTKIPEHHVSSTDENDPWWTCFNNTMKELNKVAEPEIFPAASDSRFLRRGGLPCYGFSPINNTPILLHDHNEFINEKVFLEGIRVYEKLVMNLANTKT